MWCMLGMWHHYLIRKCLGFPNFGRSLAVAPVVIIQVQTLPAHVRLSPVEEGIG
jgi:hypothetical protein